MIFAAILAGGMGSRMGGTDTPKQFLPLGNRPVIIHTIEKFVINSNIDKIIVLTPPSFINHTIHLIEEFIGDNSNIVVIEGGKTRNDTLINSINYIDENFKKFNQDKTIGIIICKKDNHFIMEYCSDERIFRTIYKINS